VVTAAQRRRAVEHLKNRRYSERRACCLLGFSRSAAWRPLMARDDEPLKSRLKALAERYPRYGYPTLHEMLKAEGLVFNPKRTYRLYREEGLQVRTKRRKKLDRPRIPMLVPDSIDQRWSMDFVSDQLANGRRFRVLNIVDDYSREIVLQVVDVSISGERVASELDRLQPSCQKLLFATTVQNLPVRQCSSGQRELEPNYILFSPVNRHKMHLSNHSMASSWITA